MGSGMGSTDRIAQEPSIPTSRKVLCLVYGAIAVVGLTATWTNNLAYLPGRFLPDFLTDLTVTRRPGPIPATCCCSPWPR